ncbi:DUF779 domain-containing protein [Microlunatus flavus]|uniref:Uncharacterized conserved protein, DUF779 family n=1 Tax=Microlunatus flavus TaxID=1036181 RepID=A0A1H9J5Z6_9ACTN|nr:DUF779 domain-containing protein [Microlunatus flavus]SEQ82290.1 Uncharacterized conserved protein, DUF779 family [Microlunatus flavus]
MLTATTTEAFRADQHPTAHGEGSRVATTRDAWQALVRLHALRGPVVLVEVGPGGPDGRRLECLTERDFAVAVADRHVGTVDRCPVYLDADADDGAHRPVYLLDVVAGAAPEATLAPDGTHHFVARPLGNVAGA